ncbi:tRNA pseudouridine(38-40) synthase TruA [Teredinibacter haidensis]|uniref:tRNA pseudouridine(38-40) synthase TruA n=1 Tax=Teredinibacter haidensis TaxID=2731755 RepID=UPI000948F0B5|nr:tRNA pseudouridine(38-40) synthase TruA [Teredinibacter haidensis]
MSSKFNQIYKRNTEIKMGTDVPEGIVRVAAGLAYSGTELHGFQKQASTEHTVQEHLERALSYVADENITLVCAGRTDAGVHATGQVVHFDTLAQRPLRAWVQGVNTQLPDDIRVLWAENVSLDFHARFRALSRTYRYVIHSAGVRSPVLKKQVTWTNDCLDINTMRDGAQSLVGEHDFSAFRASQCQAKSPVRTIERIRFQVVGELIIMEVRANAFLHHMVRNLVGSLLEVGSGRKPTTWIKELLEGRDRTRAAATAAPHGLYLVAVEYPQGFKLPVQPLGPPFIQS